MPSSQRVRIHFSVSALNLWAWMYSRISFSVICWIALMDGVSPFGVCVEGIGGRRGVGSVLCLLRKWAFRHAVLQYVDRYTLPLRRV